MDDMATEVALLKQRMSTLETQWAENLKEIKDDLRSLTKQYADLAKQLFETAKQSAAKPSWGTALIITTLCSLVTALGMYVMTH